MKVLDFGCGRDKYQASEGVYVTGLDKIDYAGVDVVHDVERKARLPFKDNEFDLIFSRNSMEHVNASAFNSLESELCRVCKPDGKIVVMVPHYTTQGAFTYPHKSYFTIESYEPFLHDFKFTVLKRRLTFGWYLKPVEWLANLSPRLYEKFFAFIIPVGGLHFELQPTKSWKQGNY